MEDAYAIWEKSGTVFLAPDLNIADHERTFLRNGWTKRGRIVTDLSKNELIMGLSQDLIQERDRLSEKLYRIQEIVDGYSGRAAMMKEGWKQ